MYALIIVIFVCTELMNKNFSARELIIIIIINGVPYCPCSVVLL